MDITIYSTTTCSFCHLLTNWLDKEGITYVKKMADLDPEVMAEFTSVSDGFMGVPFTVIKDSSGKETKIVGFDQPKFKQALGI